MFGKPEMHPLYEAPMLVLISTKKPDENMETCYIWGAVMALFNEPDTMKKCD